MKELKRRRGMVVRGTGGYGYESWWRDVLSLVKKINLWWVSYLMMVSVLVLSVVG
jgi:hypothetical protein